jgi:hypothetical protein
VRRIPCAGLMKKRDSFLTNPTPHFPLKSSRRSILQLFASICLNATPISYDTYFQAICFELLNIPRLVLSSNRVIASAFALTAPKNTTLESCMPPIFICNHGVMLGGIDSEPSRLYNPCQYGLLSYNRSKIQENISDGNKSAAMC